jgi:hypothetical protein
VITPLVRWGERCSAVLNVDQDHPFFFDHPLDHVSGMLIVTGFLDLIRTSVDPYLGARRGRRLRLSLKFLKFCELDRRVWMHAEPNPAAGGDEWAVRAVQNDYTVGKGSVELVKEVEAMPHWPTDDSPVTPIASTLVHRADPRNVVIGTPMTTSDVYDVPLFSPPSGHFLRRHGDERYGIEEIIESGRQLFTAASHLAHDRPLDTKLVWIELTADLPAGAPRCVPLALRWPVRPPLGNTGVLDIDLVARGTSRRFGSLSYVMKSFTPNAYRELREARR